MKFKDFIEIDPGFLLRFLQAIHQPTPSEEYEDGRQIILEFVQDALGGNPHPLNLLHEWADDIAIYRKQREERSKLAGLLKGFNLDIPKFLLPPKNLLSSSLGFSGPGLEFALAALRSIRVIEEWMIGGIPWEQLKKCGECERFFLKKGRRKYCGDACRAIHGQPLHEDRKDYQRTRRKFESLVNKGKSHKEAGKYLRETPPYNGIIEGGNYNPEKDWLKAENLDEEGG